MSFSVIPFSRAIVVADLNIGVLFFLAMSSMAVYGVALAGWSSNNKYALLGSIRAAGQMVSYEVFMGLSLMGVVMMAGSFKLNAIVEAQKEIWFCIPQFVGFVIFLIAGLAETRRIPFDLPEAENELVAGYHTEYSGMKFAMFFLGEYIGLTLVSAMIVTLFLGGWRGPVLPPVSVVFPEDHALRRVFHSRPRVASAAAIRSAHGVRLENSTAAHASEPRSDLYDQKKAWLKVKLWAGPAILTAILLGELIWIIGGVEPRWGQPDGQVMFMLILATAAAEVSIGLALALQLHRLFGKLDMDEISTLRG